MQDDEARDWVERKAAQERPCANRLFLVCEKHQQPDKALCLGERTAAGDRYESTPALYLSDAAAVDDWYIEHAKCGTGDHFKLAYSRPQNWDADKPKVAAAVHSIVNGSH